MEKKGIFIIVLLLILIPIISAEDFGYNYLEGELNVAQAINYTLVNVNNSIYWDGHSFDFLGDTYVPYTGANANVNLGIYNITADYFFGDGSQLTGIDVDDIWVNELGDTMTGDLNISNANYFQDAGYFKQIANITDDGQSGSGTYLDKPRGVYVVGKYLYSLSLEEDAFCIYEISNKQEINEVSCVVDGGVATQLDKPKNIFVLGKYAYIISNADDSLSVFDISDPTNITEVGTIVDGGEATGLDGPEDLYVSGRYAYISVYTEASLTIIDISDPTNLREVAVLRDGINASQILGPASLVRRGNYLYMTAKTDDSFTIFDISDPENPFETDYIQDDGAGGIATFLDGANGIVVIGNYAYITSINDDSLSVFDISNKSNILEVTTLVHGVNAEHLDGATRLLPSGDYLYVLSSADDSIVVIDISDPENPFEKGFIQDVGKGGEATHLDAPLYLFISGKYLYVAVNVDDSLVAFELSGITTPAIDTGIIRASFIQVIKDIIVAGDVNVFGSFNIGQDLVAGGIISAFGTGDNFFNGNLGIGTTTPQNTLNVVGDGNFTGNLYGSLIYGEAWYHNHTATALNFAVDGLYYNLTFDNSFVNGMTFNDAGDYLEVDLGGVYKVSYMASGYGQNNHAYFTSVTINGVVQDKCESHKKMSAGGDVVTMTGSCLLSLKIDDQIKLATADIGGTGVGEYYSSELNLVRVGN